MQFPDLPQELVSIIVRYSTISLGLHGAIRLRRVCRTYRCFCFPSIDKDDDIYL